MNWNNRKTPFLAIATCFFLLAIPMFVFRARLATCYVRYKFIHAEDQSQEKAAFALLMDPQWAPISSIGFQTKDGANFYPWETGNYDQISIVQVSWRDGVTARRQLLNKDSLRPVFDGELPDKSSPQYKAKRSRWY